MKTIELICAWCNTVFDRETKEHKRQIKRGKDKFYCSLTCVAKQRNKDFPPKGNPNNFIGYSYSSEDEYTPFRSFLFRIKSKVKETKIKTHFDIDLKYLKSLWEQQNGICPLSGQSLILPINSEVRFAEKSTLNASVDRIDSSQGYNKGNIRFVAVMSNFGRSNFTDEQFIEFCNRVALYNTYNTISVSDQCETNLIQFSKFVSRCKNHTKNKCLQGKDFGFDITKEYLKSIWDEQHGICPLTGWKMIPPISSYQFNPANPANGSIDRINNNKGYVKDNVRFVAYMANITRNEFTDEQMIEFCKAVANYNSTK